jgi:hypothetical protein
MPERAFGNGSLVFMSITLFSGSLIRNFPSSIPVGRAKASSGTGRVIPINDELLPILNSHRQWFAENNRESAAGSLFIPMGTADTERSVTARHRNKDRLDQRASRSERLMPSAWFKAYLRHPAGREWRTGIKDARFNGAT